MLLSSENINTGISVNLSNNHILPVSAMLLIQEHIGSYVASIDFSNCALINLKDRAVIEQLFMMERLGSLNNGHCFMRIDNQTGHYMDKYLKFCMKLTFIARLEIEVESVEDTEILYSVLYHILDKHQETLTSITITFTNQ